MRQFFFSFKDVKTCFSWCWHNSDCPIKKTQSSIIGIHRAASPISGGDYVMSADDIWFPHQNLYQMITRRQFDIILQHNSNQKRSMVIPLFYCNFCFTRLDIWPKKPTCSSWLVGQLLQRSVFIVLRIFSSISARHPRMQSWKTRSESWQDMLKSRIKCFQN